MGQKSLEVSINPAVLKWARESAGWAVEEISKKIRINPDTFQKLESGKRLPTLNTLEKLANYFKNDKVYFK